jgi:hypothetical protein
VEFAIELRDSWKESPTNRESLACHRISLSGVFPKQTPEELAWVSAWLERPWELLPHPHVQTLKDYLRFAENLYRRRERFRSLTDSLPTRQPKRDHLGRHVGWFVQVQVLGKSPAAVAKADSVDRKAVEREAKKIASLLQVERRARRRGRPLLNAAVNDRS